MDEYVKSIKEEVKSEDNIDNVAVSNYRELFLKFIQATPQIKIEQISKGDITFSVSIKEMGLNYQDLQKLRTEIYSYLSVNFIGELLVRENIDHFAHILTKINKEKYADVVNGFEHKKFGLKISKSRFQFCFHISLVQSILNENFRREVRMELEKS